MNMFEEDRFLLKALINNEPWLMKELALYEGLISTASLQSTNNVLSRKYKTYPYWKDNRFDIICSGTETIGEIKNLLVTTNNLGWFPSYIKTPTKSIKYKESILFSAADIGVPFRIGFEAKYDIEIDKSKLPKKLFHVTLTSKIEKIKKQGLTPKSYNKLSTHPDRIYLYNSQAALKSLLDRMKQLNPKDQNYSVIEIDVADLPIYVRFFRDPNFENGYYTLSNIHPHELTFKSL